MLGLTLTSKLKEAEEKLEEEKKKQMEKREEAERLSDELKRTYKTGDFKGLEDKINEVEELDEPRLAWKRTQNHVLELVIPAGEKVVHPRGDSDKKRTSRVFVRKIINKNGEEASMSSDNILPGMKLKAYHEVGFSYTENTFETPDELNEELAWNCTNGIHVFSTMEEAIEYKPWDSGW